mgnify:CR=1 FL=1
MRSLNTMYADDRTEILNVYRRAKILTPQQLTSTRSNLRSAHPDLLSEFDRIDNEAAA